MEDIALRKQQIQSKRRQSKISSQNQYADGQVINKKYSNLQREDIDGLSRLFHRMDIHKTGKIQFNELITIFSHYYTIDNKVKEKIFKELEDKSIKSLDLDAVLILGSMLKEYFSNYQSDSTHEYQNEYIDAFVALGGGGDQSGFVGRQKILDIISHEFELTIDMAQYLEKLELQDEQLDFHSFCQVFEREDRELSRAGSVLSILSSRSRKSVLNINPTLQSQDSFKQLKVRYRDFEKFEAEYDQKEQEKTAQQMHLHNIDEDCSPTSAYSPDKLY